MKKSLVAMTLLAAVAVASAQGGWKNPAYITATISERADEGAARELTVTKKGDSFSYLTTNEIDGMLGGTERVEVASPQGFYTWLRGHPEMVLRLWSPTSLDVFDYLAQPKFSRADLEVYLEGIEKALGKKVLVGKSEQIAGRDCLVLTILDQPGSSSDYQRLWIDRETGIAMKLMDVSKGKTDYEREVKSISFAAPGKDVLFAPMEGAKILQGIILPTTLVNAFNPKPSSGLGADIANVNKQSKQPWAGAGEIAGYGYTGTQFRQVRKDTFQVRPDRIDPREEARRRRAERRGNQIARRAFFSSNGEAQTVEIRLAAGSDLSSAVILTEGQQLNEPPTTASSTSTGGQNTGSGSEKSVVYPMVQSDFVDPATGATLTLLQIENRDLKPWLAPLGLSNGETVANQSAGNAVYYSVDWPVKVNVLTWQVGQTRMALVATNLSKDALLELAGKIQPVR